jgi:methyltransferase
MQWVYPGLFVAMAIEGSVVGPSSPRLAMLGVVVFAISKLLKAWAIQTLGVRWTFRVFVLPGAPLIATGPYRVMRHPNYAAVIGELAGMAMIVGARVTGPLAVICFAYLLRQRVDVEERALGIPRQHRGTSRLPPNDGM